MASLVLQNVPSNLLERLELRAKTLGVTPSEEALRLLRASLMEGSQRAVVEASLEANALVEERNGLLVFTGHIDPASVPDVHEVREQRVDELIQRTDEGRD